MLEQLKKQVYDANIELVKKGLVLYTWGNVSQIDPDRKYLVIKPSGVDYDNMTPDDMVITDMQGNVVEGRYKPSSDTHTHIQIYKAFANANGVVHTHSTYATAFAQAGLGIPAYGTTHADYFYGLIPCTRDMEPHEILTDYEKNTGLLIAETFEQLNPDDMPACLVKSHGPFAWGVDAAQAVFNAVVLEQLAKTAFLTRGLNSDVKPIKKHLLNKHYKRKHGKSAYYGQDK